MTTITMDDIQRDLIGYLQRVKAGETLVVLDENQPVVQIKPVAPNGARLRPYALCAGEFRVPEDFDAPLPDEIIEQFEG
ncbi:type II toxin-antitoxin system Phd/YefM family antitoxin [Dehalococcoidia bacterium]|nr:type II toxin-antitoxin system Phd/YefM family antitoxin [Dehalococcoidia bacterium]MCL0057435.1 type II toxin-antitoxin system Phd/YefM family antitoxin [Dehalococcoidia bacterium]MCL0058760.1 type II toxin-antitoxin system Phd/YefM family antitoxin [Dehalococcoidia bacterium]MCL0093643.1 type II toxin-antitoxin system Phd/YefM family antitoxin [Dehalococcoidia bacterium]